MTTIHDLSGPAEALYSEALKSGDPAGYLRTADGWSLNDRLAVAAVLDVDEGQLIAALVRDSQEASR